MTENYFQEKTSEENILPSNEAIQFILNYSKSVHFIKCSKEQGAIEVNLN